MRLFVAFSVGMADLLKEVLPVSSSPHHDTRSFVWACFDGWPRTFGDFDLREACFPAIFEWRSAVSEDYPFWPGERHWIFKCFGWEETKNKSARGGYVEYAKLATAKLDGMAGAELGKFLMVCALASDLFFPPYFSSGGTLPKEAAHYKMNADRILREAKEKFVGKSSNAEREKQLQAPAKRKTR
jgi:hypothetical protein